MRLNIAFAVLFCSRYIAKFIKVYITVIKRIFRYLLSTINLQLIFLRIIKNLISFTDVNWAGNT